jgi:hypothetical protein
MNWCGVCGCRIVLVVGCGACRPARSVGPQAHTLQDTLHSALLPSSSCSVTCIVELCGSCLRPWCAPGVDQRDPPAWSRTLHVAQPTHAALARARTCNRSIQPFCAVASNTHLPGKTMAITSECGAPAPLVFGLPRAQRCGLPRNSSNSALSCHGLRARRRGACSSQQFPYRHVKAACCPAACPAPQERRWVT